MPVVDDSNQPVIRLPDCQKNLGGDIALFELCPQTLFEANPFFKGSAVFQSGTAVETVAVLYQFLFECHNLLSVCFAWSEQCDVHSVLSPFSRVF